MNIASNLQPPQTRSLKVGDGCFLDDEIEPGLFEDEDGNRYLNPG